MADDRTLWVRRGNALYPADAMAQEALQAFPEDQEMLVSAKVARKPWQHKKVWALAQKIAETADFYDARDAMDYILIKARWHKQVTRFRIFRKGSADPDPYLRVVFGKHLQAALKSIGITVGDDAFAELLQRIKASYDANEGLPGGSQQVEEVEEMELRPRSIAFHAVGQEKFERLFKRILSVVTKDILPGVSEADVVREVEDIIDGRHAAEQRREAESRWAA